MHLFNHLGIKNEKEEESLILHNWMHSSSSRSKYYKNTVSKKTVTHITTSYWMPERPDLQPIIAHEIAHKFIKSRLGDISGKKISDLNDDFSFFLLRINKKIDDFYNNSLEVFVDPKSITKELSCDFIAASIKGIKYVYAHFIELLSSDISFFGSLTRNGKDIDYDHIGNFSYAHLDQFYDNRLWYLRIKMILAWLDKIQHTENSTLDEELVKGINKIVDDILDFYMSLALTEEDRKKEDFWITLTTHLVDIVNDSDNVTSSVKEWNIKKSNDIFNKKTGKKTTTSQYPRSVARIDIRVRQMLYETQRYMKTLEGRLLSDFQNASTEELSDAFDNVYGVSFKIPTKLTDLDQQQDGNSPIYLHIYDIIWQSSMMRAKDLLFTMSGQDKIRKIVSHKNHDLSSFLKILHFEFPMGRDLFSFALEFSIFDQDSPHDRLMAINYLLDIENNQKKQEDSKLYTKINKWYKGSSYNLPHENKGVDDLLKNIKTESRGSHEHRKMDDKIGRKIKDFFTILKDQKKEVKKDSRLIPVYYFLKTKDKDSKSENLFHEMVLEGFSLNDNNRKSLSLGYLIGNISLSASYAQLRENKKEADSFETASHNMLKQSNVLTSEKEYWRDDDDNPNEKHPCYYFKQLGRYDVLLMKPSTSLTRCSLPFFPDSSSNTSKRLIDKEKLSSFIIKNGVAIVFLLGKRPDISSDTSESSIYKEKFPSFFTKKEMAIPFVLGRNSWNEDLSQCKILVTLRIKLKQRNYRLSFLYRLRMTCLNSNKYGYDFIENMTNKFQIAEENEKGHTSEDRAFLVDGADDILLLFMAKNAKNNSNKEIKERLDEISVIQNSLYEDFMVDRTRLAFSQDCLRAIRVDNKDEYRAILFIRLLEDRHLTPMNREYLNDIDKKELGVTFYKSPGEYDYYADITLLIKNNSKDINLILNDFSESKYVDSINTKLLHKEEYLSQEK